VAVAVLQILLPRSQPDAIPDVKSKRSAGGIEANSAVHYSGSNLPDQLIGRH